MSKKEEMIEQHVLIWQETIMQFQKYHQNISKCVENLEMFLNDCIYDYLNHMHIPI